MILKDKETNQIEGIFLLQDFPYDLCQNESFNFLQPSNWYSWLKSHFEDPGPACHSLWLCSWIVNDQKYFFSEQVRKALLQSIFISYPRVDTILAYKDSKQHTEFNPKDLGFESLHRVQTKVRQQHKMIKLDFLNK